MPVHKQIHRFALLNHDVDVFICPVIKNNKRNQKVSNIKLLLLLSITAPQTQLIHRKAVVTIIKPLTNLDETFSFTRCKNGTAKSSIRYADTNHRGRPKNGK